MIVDCISSICALQGQKMKTRKWEKWLYLAAGISFIQLILGYHLYAIWSMLFLIMILLMVIVYILVER
jgi:hypothetical protein